MQSQKRNNTDNQLRSLFRQYAKRRSPLEVNFRKMVPWLGHPDRWTHLIHPYPAKVLMHIPHFFLANSLLSRPGDTVLDPFAGAGTVLLEAISANRVAIGADSNAMARLISQVKTHPLPSVGLNKALSKILIAIPDQTIGAEPDIINIKHWFYRHVIDQLLRLRSAIQISQQGHYRSFFDVCFSSCVRKVSLAAPRLSVPVRLRENQYGKDHPLREKTKAHIHRLRRVNVYRVFTRIAESNIIRMQSLFDLATSATASVVSSDARHLQYEFGSTGTQLPDESVQLIITSPPYVGAQKYVRAMSLSLGWLNLCTAISLRTEKNNSIGREEYRKEEYSNPTHTDIQAADRLLTSIRSVNPLRAHIAAQYLCEMREALTECTRVLKPEGYLVLVIGNNHICGHEFLTVDYLETLLRRTGLSLRLRLIDDIKSRGLMTKRNKTAGMIAQECVLVFQK